jgi:hypothetical protein
MKKTLMVRVLVVLMLSFSALTLKAQPCDPGDPDNPAPCPIDGGVSLLIAAGIGLGAKKAYDQKKKAETRNY